MEHSVVKKQIIIGGILIFAVTLFAPRIAQAQGTMTYLSSLSQTPTGTLPVGNDHWLAAMFGTGNNTGGYSLNSVQLGMADASGSPSNFTVMIYSAVVGGGISPGANLDTLDVSLSPTSAGIYTFSAISNLLLVLSTIYFVVVTGGTTIADGAYSWNESLIPSRCKHLGGGKRRSRFRRWSKRLVSDSIPRNCAVRHQRHSLLRSRTWRLWFVGLGRPGLPLASPQICGCVVASCKFADRAQICPLPQAKLRR